MQNIAIINANIINEGRTFLGGVLVEGEYIIKVVEGTLEVPSGYHVIDAEGKWLMPGAIDDQVHFREPGLTHKAEIATESAAAVAGGITSFMEMPNTKPQAVTNAILEEKYARAAQVSLANYSFFLGATNDNIDELVKVDPKNVCGVKVFMGSSTGNMLVDKQATLDAIFSQVPTLIATHCEDEATIRSNMAAAKATYGEDVPIAEHPKIRSGEACYLSSSFAVELAKKHGTRLHVLHLSTAKETELFEPGPYHPGKKITSEVCVHHLKFSDEDYATKGALIKWNPAVKTKADKEGLLQALKDGRITVIATDHAPHLPEEKVGGAAKAMSGGPLVQHAVVMMMDMAQKGLLTKELVVEKMSHTPAELFNIEKRGYIREGYFADLVLVDPNKKWTVDKSNILYKCGWSPLEGEELSVSIDKTIVNGRVVYEDGKLDKSVMGKRLTFDR